MTKAPSLHKVFLSSRIFPPSLHFTAYAMTIAAAEATRKPTGLLRGQAAKIARIHRCTVRHVIGVARAEWGGRPALLKTIEDYRARNTAAAESQFVAASA